jgi:DNA (cytosine-5)-methyltransferase 1
MSLGFKRVPGFEVRFAVDAQKGKPSSGAGRLECNDTYAANIGVQVREADLSTYSPKQLAAEANLKPGDLDVLISCAPCTGFSRTLRDNHVRDDPRNHLVQRSGLFVEHLRPRIFLMENARELLMGNFRHHAEALMERLRQLDYSIVAEVRMLSDFGLPQYRERALLIAARDNAAIRSLDDLWRGYRITPNALTVRHAIEHLPPVDAGTTSPMDPMHTSPGFSDPTTLERLRAIPPDGGSWADLVRHPNAQRLLIPSMRRAAENGDWGSHPDVYGRLWWDRPCVTIKRECSHVGNGRYSHPEQDRLCTVRELALLNGFPSDFVFQGSLSNKYRHIGDAVPPLISYQLARACQWMLTGKKPSLTSCVMPKTSLRKDDVSKRTAPVDLFDFVGRARPATRTSSRAGASTGSPVRRAARG